MIELTFDKNAFVILLNEHEELKYGRNEIILRQSGFNYDRTCK